MKKDQSKKGRMMLNKQSIARLTDIQKERVMGGATIPTQPTTIGKTTTSTSFVLSICTPCNAA
jgi:hypothetical protein